MGSPQEIQQHREYETKVDIIKSKNSGPHIEQIQEKKSCQKYHPTFPLSMEVWEEISWQLA